MKTLIQNGYGSVDVLQYAEEDTPMPLDHEVLVKIFTTAINDWELGILKLPKILRPIIGLSAPRGKFRTMGCDMAGTVQATGRSAAKFKTGDQVYCDLSDYRFGGFAEYVCVKESALARKPASMTFEQAASIPHAAELALQAIHAAPTLRKGQHVLVNGAGGGVGTLLVQLLKPYQVEVTGVDCEEKLELLREIGYDAVVQYPKQDFTKLAKQYDLIIDTKTYLPALAYQRALKPDGCYITVGGKRLLRFVLAAKILNLFSRKCLKVLALKPNKNLERINEIFESGQLTPVIDSVFPFTEIPQAMTRFIRAEHKGKIVIQVCSE